MENINDKLQALYNANIDGIHKIFYSNKNIDGPHLMFCNDELYKSSKRKIMFIGQEGTGNVFRDYLGHPSDPNLKGERIHYSNIPKLFLQNCIQNYIDIFNKQQVKPGGEFWRQLLKINKALNGEQSTNGFLYNNVSKYCNCESNGKPPLTWVDHKFVVENLNILSKEIEITKPDVIIFLTGPNYDEKISCQFEGEMNFISINEEIPSRVLAKVIHPLLPKYTYRTYHPAYLKRKKLDYINHIILDINND